LNFFPIISDSPQVKLIGSPEGDLEENKTPVTLRCIADANPPAQVNWKRIGGSQTYSFQVSSNKTKIYNHQRNALKDFLSQ